MESKKFFTNLNAESRLSVRPEPTLRVNGCRLGKLSLWINVNLDCNGEVDSSGLSLTGRWLYNQDCH